MAFRRGALRAHVAQQLGRFKREVGGLDGDVAQLAHLRREFGDLEQGDRLGGLLHLVDGVVERGGQVADVAAVEGGDEGAADGQENVAGDLVGRLLVPDDRGAGRGHPGTAVEKLAQGFGALDQQAGVGLEPVEEPLFLRQEGLEPSHDLLPAARGPDRPNRAATIARPTPRGVRRRPTAPEPRDAPLARRPHDLGRNPHRLRPLQPRQGRTTRGRSQGLASAWGADREAARTDGPFASASS